MYASYKPMTRLRAMLDYYGVESARGRGIEMSLKRLTRMKFMPTAVVEALHNRDIFTSKDFLNKSPLEIMAILGYSYSQLQELTLLISKMAAPTQNSVLLMYKSRGNSCVATSISRLDTLLRGGLPAGMITEISGPSGCGKTQFCLTISVATALTSRKNVAYIDTEGAFSAERLMEIANNMQSGSSSSKDLLSFASRVHVFTEMSCQCLLGRLRQLDEIVVDKGINLVIVDSIASLVRKEFDASSKRGVADRAAILNTQAARLKYIAEVFQIPILVTNQITTKVSYDQEVLEGSWVTAALGNSWSHAVNTRLLMQHNKGNTRIVTVSKSPICDVTSFVVVIESRGLVLDKNETDKLDSETERFNKDPQQLSLAAHLTSAPHITL